MKLFLAVFAFVSVLSSHLSADILLLPDSISVKTDIEKFHYTFFEKTMDDPGLKNRGLMQCVELKELEGALLCAAGKKAYMNKAFSRASLFSEGSAGIEKGQVFELDSKEVVGSSEILGHNIPSDELKGFWNALAKACSPSQNCASPEELELFEKVMIPMSFKRPQFIALTYAFDAEWSRALSHELKHGQYFLNTKYRETVDLFWNETVSKEDKERIRNLLGRGYNKNDEAVMRNEFQAFLLEKRASENALRDFVPFYRDLLIQKLQEAGLELLF